jgi:acyl-CoA synthetase (NDP forming)
LLRRENLKRLLNPRSVAFIGGRGLSVAIETARSVGFRGDIWVVNPKGGEIAGLRCFTSLSELPPLSEVQMADMNDYMAGFVNLTNPLDFNTQVWGRPELEVRCFTGVMQGDQYDATALVHDYPSPERSDPSAWEGVCNSFIEAHCAVRRPAVLISNVGETLPAEGDSGA